MNHRRTQRIRGHKHAARDLAFIVVSIAVAGLLSHYGVFDAAVDALRSWDFFASFIAGMFFTSLFTLAPASVVLVELSHVSSVFSVVLWGAAGAVIGDMLIFLFVRDALAEDVKELLKAANRFQILHVFRLRLFRRLSPFIGALIIVVPFLPDELGIALMGLSHVRTSVMIPVSFAMNALGVLIVVYTAAFFG